MSYITRDHVKLALADMQKFHTDLQSLHTDHGVSIKMNLGRRNMMMSAPQEAFFAKALSSSYSGVSHNGNTGEADILIGELDTELECKITSPQGAGGMIRLQTDYATLTKKKSLDYLYVLADRKFEKFVVLHYTNLVPGDFAIPSKSSRGKSSMKKHLAHKKCKVLWGDVINKNNINLVKLEASLKACSQRAVKKRERLERSIAYWTTTPASFGYVFEDA